MDFIQNKKTLLNLLPNCCLVFTFMSILVFGRQFTALDVDKKTVYIGAYGMLVLFENHKLNSIPLPARFDETCYVKYISTEDTCLWLVISTDTISYYKDFLYLYDLRGSYWQPVDSFHGVWSFINHGKIHVIGTDKGIVIFDKTSMKMKYRTPIFSGLTSSSIAADGDSIWIGFSSMFALITPHTNFYHDFGKHIDVRLIENIGEYIYIATSNELLRYKKHTSALPEKITVPASYYNMMKLNLLSTDELVISEVEFRSLKYNKALGRWVSYEIPDKEGLDWYDIYRIDQNFFIRNDTLWFATPNVIYFIDLARQKEFIELITIEDIYKQ